MELFLALGTRRGTLALHFCDALRHLGGLCLLLGRLGGGCGLHGHQVAMLIRSHLESPVRAGILFRHGGRPAQRRVFDGAVEALEELVGAHRAKRQDGHGYPSAYEVDAILRGNGVERVDEDAAAEHCGCKRQNGFELPRERRLLLLACHANSFMLVNTDIMPKRERTYAFACLPMVVACGRLFSVPAESCAACMERGEGYVGQRAF